MSEKLRGVIGELEQVLNNTKTELAEFEKGRKVSAPELRKLAQVSKSLWQDFRIQVMDELKSMPTKKRTK
jgi:hypothetical protein